MAQEDEDQPNYRELRKIYGPPQKIDVNQAFKDAIQESLDKRTEMLKKLKEHFQVADGKWPTYRAMAPIARQLGHTDYADAWERS
jgi:hypothetical protein